MLHGQPFNIFYDTGCSDFVITIDAVNRLGSNAVQEYAGPIILGGVGDTLTKSLYGVYRVKIPLCSGDQAVLSGVCLDKITSPFPVYQLADAGKDISIAAGSIELPKLPDSVGGQIDMMIGIKYLRHHPKLIFQAKSGLSIYQSRFHSINETRGILGGHHHSFLGQSMQTNHFSKEYKSIKSHSHFSSEVSMCGFKDSVQEISYFDEIRPSVFSSNPLKSFNQIEEVGSEITYRCTTCRECKKCKNYDSHEAVSIREEAEQAIINSSVDIDLTTRVAKAKLPFINDPHSKLAPNKMIATKVYNQQLKKLNKFPKDKADVLQSEAKLQSLGYVDYVKNLPSEVQETLSNNPIQNFIAWRAVWKPSSVSTPCRIVFDASQATATGYSLNDLLAKGRNNLNRLQDILIRWSIHKVAIHTDVRKMYNTINLDQAHWCFQRYIWQENLDPTKIPEEKVIKTLIYGVKSSGNQAEYGLREVARISAEEYPEVHDIIHKDVYVDDCISGEHTIESARRRSDEIELVVNRGGFQLKGVSLSGEDPLESLTDDGITINVAGMKWYPKEDQLSLNICELNFSKRIRGIRSDDLINQVPEKLTRRHCVSKVAEVFDLTGKVTPLTASMKLDLHELVTRGLQWDDVLPDNLRALWLTNFEMMQEIRNLRYNRTIVPDDAVNLELDTIDFADASPSLACVAIYARFKRRNGEYSCQLVLACSRLIPKNTSQPRGELFAALLNAHSGEVVRRSFYKWHQSSLKLSDSQIALYWICNNEKPLKQWIRNRVIKIQRFSNPTQWFYIPSEHMIADIGTRKGVSIRDVDQSSAWINGYEWMRQVVSKSPIKSNDELKLSNVELKEAHKECLLPEVFSTICIKQIVPSEVSKRYQFSNYLVDPNKHVFSKVVRIIAYILRFITCCKSSKINLTKNSNNSNCPKELKVPKLSSDEIIKGEIYLFQKCTNEIKHFLPDKKYQHISKEINGILMYTGRILPTTEVTCTGKFTNAMKDLSSTTFCVPLVDKFSPVAYSIINNVHWNDKSASDCGVETTLRYVLKKAHILEGRAIVKSIRKSCQRCRYLTKKTLDAAMGPISRHNLNIAPAFFIAQVDLSGPYKAYSPHNKRATIKIWLVVFCCCTTSATIIKCMDDYSTSSFVQSFIRFSCDVGFPKKLLCDEGSQLVKGCQDTKLNFRDAGSQLFKDVNVDFEVCPVGGHNMHVKVERKIKEVNHLLEKSISNERLSLLQWETVAAQISNCINNLPIGLGSLTGDLENLDLLTPNRLRLGRNNDRSPSEEMITMNEPSKIIKQNEEVFTAWFEVWLLSYVRRLMNQQKWHKTDQINKGTLSKQSDHS